MYYVYLHIKLSNGEPFYIGKGKENRCYSTSKRNNFWKGVVNKHGFDVIILEDGLSEEETFELEKYWIKRIGRRDLGLGTLVNMTNGGEGSSGIIKILTEEQKKNISNGRKGIVFSDEHLSNLKKSRKNIKLSDTHKKNIGLATSLHKGKMVINLETGFFFDSAQKAAEAYNINPGTLRGMLNGSDKNKTNLRYVINS